MSSARNHAKRSHRSEHFKAYAMGVSARKVYTRYRQKPQRFSLFKALADRLRKNKAPAN